MAYSYLEPLKGLPAGLKELCSTHSEHPEAGGSLLFSMRFKVTLPTKVQRQVMGEKRGKTGWEVLKGNAWN